jgi:hypothetical protein
MGHLVPDMQAKLLATQKERSGIAKTEAETATHRADLRQKQNQWAWVNLGNSPTPEIAIDNINKSVQDGTLSFKEGNAEIQRLTGISEPEFAKYRLGSMTRALENMDAVNARAPKVRQQEMGGKFVSVNDNPLMPNYNQPTGQEFVKTPTFAEKTAQGQLGLAQRKFQYEQDNPEE